MNEIKIRNAVLSDIKNIYELSNSEYVRKMSKNKKNFTYEEHIKWFNNKLNDKNSRIYVVLMNDVFSGQVKFDIKEDTNIAFVGISLMPNLKGKGFSELILNMAIQEFQKENLNVDKLFAEIYDYNIASIKLFESCGFFAIKKEDDLFTYHKELKRSVFIVEMSANHGHNIEIAKKTILAAKEAGADAVKMQTYRPDTITIDCKNEFFQINNGTLWDGTTLYKLYESAYMPWEWHEELYAYAKSIGITIFNPIYKIASFEITDIPLIKYIARLKKPIIISTGVATFQEIVDAIDACHSVGNYDITLLKCTSQYPAKKEDANISTMIEMEKLFKVKVGLSDHTIGTEVSEVAVASNAKVIEKHFILDKSIGGADASFSMEPKDFKKLVANIRKKVNILGNSYFPTDASEIKNRKFARSLFIVTDVKKGDIVTENNIRSIRPSDGLMPKFYDDVLGCTFIGDYKAGTPLSWDKIKIGDEKR